MSQAPQESFQFRIDMHHPQRASAREYQSENLCAAFEIANARWGHEANRPRLKKHEHLNFVSVHFRHTHTHYTLIRVWFSPGLSNYQMSQRDCRERWDELSCCLASSLSIIRILQGQVGYDLEADCCVVLNGFKV